MSLTSGISGTHALSGEGMATGKPRGENGSFSTGQSGNTGKTVIFRKNPHDQAALPALANALVQKLTNAGSTVSILINRKMETPEGEYGEPGPVMTGNIFEQTSPERKSIFRNIFKKNKNSGQKKLKREKLKYKFVFKTGKKYKNIPSLEKYRTDAIKAMVPDRKNIMSRLTNLKNKFRETEIRLKNLSSKNKKTIEGETRKPEKYRIFQQNRKIFRECLKNKSAEEKERLFFNDKFSTSILKSINTGGNAADNEKNYNTLAKRLIISLGLESIDSTIDRKMVNEQINHLCSSTGPGDEEIDLCILTPPDRPHQEQEGAKTKIHGKKTVLYSGETPGDNFHAIGDPVVTASPQNSGETEDNDDDLFGEDNDDDLFGLAKSRNSSPAGVTDNDGDLDLSGITRHGPEGKEAQPGGTINNANNGSPVIFDDDDDNDIESMFDNPSALENEGMKTGNDDIYRDHSVGKNNSSNEGEIRNGTGNPGSVRKNMTGDRESIKPQMTDEGNNDAKGNPAPEGMGSITGENDDETARPQTTDRGNAGEV